MSCFVSLRSMRARRARRRSAATRAAGALGAIVAAVVIVALSPLAAASDDSDRMLSIDHFVTVRSTAPAIDGQHAQVYVRERVKAGTILRSASMGDRVVLFVHGAGTPGHVAFDVARDGYSWMAALAAAGFDVFALDFTGYGRSTRPAPMNDPCNVAADRQAELVPVPLGAPCPPSYPGAATTIASDWSDLGAVVDYIRTLRRVDRVSLVGWSLGGPRASGYALRHPEKVHRLALLAPAYNRGGAAAAPAALPAPGGVMAVQSRADFMANWERQVACEGQMDPAAADAVWADMIASDPVGATWGPGVRRAPQTTTWGWNREAVSGATTPALLVAPVHDRQVPPQRVRELYEDYGAPGKVLVDLGCASHNAMWEDHRDILFRVTREWLERGTVDGVPQGVVRLGYADAPPATD